MSFDLNRQAADLTTVVAAIGRLQRRDFLRFAGAAGVACSLAGAAGAGLPSGVKFMSESEAAVFTRLAQVVLPVGGSPLVPWTSDGLLQTLDGALLAGMEPHILAGLKGGVKYFDDGPMATYKKRFTELSDAEATQFCDAWGASTEPPQRGLAMGLKKLVQLSYWANPATWAPLGYDGPMTQRLGIKRIGNAPLPTR
jgi:hypothetical protein